MFLLLLAPEALSVRSGTLTVGLPGVSDRASLSTPPTPQSPAAEVATPAAEPTAVPDPSLYRLPRNWQKGFVLWDRPESFGSPESFQSLRQLRDDGATSISPVITWYVAGPWDPHIHPGKGTPTDDDLMAAIDEAHSLGLQVMLRFHIDCDDGSWRARIDPQDKDAFFNAYTTVLGYYARLAREHAVEGIVVGAELSALTRPAYTDYWRRIIAVVRDRFPGFLTYSAQWGSAPPDAPTDPYREFEQVQFWDDLDYLGISGYFELAAGGQTPSLESYVERWGQWRLLLIEPFQARYNKPLIFTEIGYASTPSAALHPWAGGGAGAVDLQLQAELYAALFESWADVPWFRGAYFWFWPTSPDGAGLEGADYPPSGKPAEEVLRRWYRLLDDMEQPPWNPARAEGTIPQEEGR